MSVGIFFSSSGRRDQEGGQKDVKRVRIYSPSNQRCVKTAWREKVLSAVLLCLSLLQFQPFSYGQDLEKIGKKDMVTVGGGMGYNAFFQQVSNQPQQRDPFSWVYSGNVNVNFLGVSMPFTFSFSNQGKSYTQPFNMTALHPQWKWVKTHIGITSMQFSPYTYSGMNFAGGGVELSPKKWRVKAFGGRFKKAVEYDPTINNISTVSYRRMGGGLSFGYEAQKGGFNVIVIKAADDQRSLEQLTPNSELTPMDNLVTSVSGKLSVVKNLQLQAEYALSMLTRNTLLSDSLVSGKRPFYFDWVNGNASTTAKSAYNASLSYRFKTASVAVKYERIAPDYLTLGGLFFNNDLENITVAPAVSLLHNKLTISANTGFQRNNLSGGTASIQRRWVASVNLNAQPFKGCSVNGAYSNFSTFTRRNPSAMPLYDPVLDTMNFYQVSENYTTDVTYTFGTKRKQAVTSTFAYVKSQNITGRLQDAGAFGYNTGNTGIPADVYTGMAAYTLQFMNGLALSCMGNYNRAVVAGVENTFFGPGMNASKSVLGKKMNLQTGATYNRQLTGTTLTNHVMNLRLGVTYSPELFDKKFGRVAFSANGNFTQKFALAEGVKSPTNLTVMMNLNYSF